MCGRISRFRSRAGTLTGGVAAAAAAAHSARTAAASGTGGPQRATRAWRVFSRGSARAAWKASPTSRSSARYSSRTSALLAYTPHATSSAAARATGSSSKWAAISSPVRYAAMRSVAAWPKRRGRFSMWNSVGARRLRQCATAASDARSSPRRWRPSARKTLTPLDLSRRPTNSVPHPRPLREMDRSLSDTAKSVAHRPVRRFAYSAMFSAVRNSALVMDPSPTDTNDTASDGHDASTPGSRPASSSPSPRPSACGAWLARVEVTR